MDSFGDRLRSEREGRGLSIQFVGEILRVDHDLLRALERNDFEALPDEAVMTRCLHGYAECLEVDAGLMIEDYAGEREKHLRGRVDVGAKRVAGVAAAVVPGAAKGRKRLSPWPVVLAVGLIAPLAAWWLLSRDAPAPRTAETRVLAAQVQAEVEELPVPSTEASGSGDPVALRPPRSEAPADVPRTASAVAPTPVAPPAGPSVAPAAGRSTPGTATSSTLRVTEQGVGTAVANRQLVGRSDRFTEGVEVHFWTRVEGGARGSGIDHVWLHEGAEAARVSLQLGGSNWRTYSTKTVQAAGQWAVEARDDAGRVLARSEFDCVP